VDKRKDAILGFLKTCDHASLAEVAAHLELSKQGALRHLDALRAEGLIEQGSDSHDGPGRPAHVYALTAAAADHFPHGHRQLAGDLVHFLGQEQLARFFSERSARMESAIAPKLQGLDLEQRVRRLAELASATGHMSEVVDNGDGSFAIRHCNCPIADVAAETGHPCQREQSMYGRLLGAEVERTTWMAASDSTCTYVVKSK